MTVVDENTGNPPDAGGTGNASPAAEVNERDSVAQSAAVSHNPENSQTGKQRWPSTSLARLAYVEIVEIGKKLEWVEALDASKARHWSRH